MESPTHPLICLIGQLGNGGTERQLYLFLKHLDRDEWNPLVVVGGDSAGIWRERVEELDVPVTLLGAGSPLVKLLKFRLLVAKHKPLTVFSWSFFTNAFAMASGKARFIGSLRQQFSVEKGQYGAFRLNRCLNIPRLIVNSTFVKNELIEHGVEAEKITVVFNIFERFQGAKVDKAEIRQHHGIPLDRCLVTGVGRNSPTKDFPFFVAAVEKALAADNNIHAMIVGSGGSSVETIVKDKGLSDRFSLVGEVPDARPYLAASDVFFLSSRQEGMPNVLLEAVDAGCATLVTRVGGVTDVLGERELGEARTGAAITHGNVEEAAVWLTRMGNEASLRATMSANAVKRLDLFTAERATAEFEKLIQA